MFRLSEGLRFYLYSGGANLRRGCLSLCETIRSEMKSNPRNEGNVYVFMNRKRTIARLIHYERGFWVMYEKRPESGRFRKPVYDAASGKVRISRGDLVCLLEGLARTEIRLSPLPSEKDGEKTK